MLVYFWFVSGAPWTRLQNPRQLGPLSVYFWNFRMFCRCFAFLNTQRSRTACRFLPEKAPILWEQARPKVRSVTFFPLRMMCRGPLAANLLCDLWYHCSTLRARSFCDLVLRSSLCRTSCGLKLVVKHVAGLHVPHFVAMSRRTSAVSAPSLIRLSFCSIRSSHARLLKKIMS